ncbi:MAG: diguanylate cyclase, partial [Dokdonella sp.]
SRMLINPLLIVIGPMLLLCGVVALLRGSRYAIYFLIGWTPLLVVTVLSSLQTLGVFVHWTSLNDLGIATAAFEALVLSLGLADRALAMRRDRERVGVLAETDPLTGLCNRRAWLDRAQALLDSTQRDAHPFCVMFLDLDRFKQLNDSGGHEAGDAALVRVAELMRSAMRHREVIGRYGGEEFVVALPDCALPAAVDVAARVRKSIEDQAIALGIEGRVLTTCIGVAERSPGETLSRLIARADAAMYVAKSEGRNRVVVANSRAPPR